MHKSMDEVFSALQEMAARSPASIALVSSTRQMSYGNFVGNINSAAATALRSGIKPGQLVVLAPENQDALLILLFALMRIGCRVGFTKNLPLYEASDVRVDVVIGDKSTPDIGRPVVSITPDWFAGGRAINLNLPVVASDCSLISSSSGSTGRPKLIEYRTAALLRRLNLIGSVLADFPGIRYFSLHGRRTSPTLIESIVTLLSGGMVIHPPDPRSGSVLDAIQLYGPDYLSAPPKVLLELLRELDAKPRIFRKVKMVRSTGAFLAPHVLDAALDRITEEVMSTYASTEISWIAWGTSDNLRKVPGSVGKVSSGVEVATFDADNKRLPAGAEGEIRVKCSEELACSFPGDQAAPRNAFVDGWFATGDIGLLDENRNLILRGRTSNVINIGGAKINPEVLEEQLSTFAGVLEVGVAGVDGEDGFQQVCAAIVSASSLTADEINQQFRQRGQWFEVSTIRNVEAIPKTENGKIDRKALKLLCAE